MLTRIAMTPALNQMQQEMDRLFETVFSAAGRPHDAGERPRQDFAPAFPPLNVWEDENHVYVEAELPGITAENIDLSVLGGELTISGHRRMTLPENATIVRHECGNYEFRRPIRLPSSVNAESIEPALDNGVLTITMPKTPQAKARRIEVRTGSPSSSDGRSN